MVQEEKAADGLQRHLWWKMELPGAEGVLAYVSPVFNAVWVASAKAHFNAGADLNNSTNRRSPGHTLHLGARHCGPACAATVAPPQLCAPSALPA